MSNCIELHHHTVKFTADDMDTARLWEDLTTHVDHEESCNTAPCSMARWFLVPDVNVIPQKIVNTNLTILFGQGRSSHTWRDFDQTVAFIDTYMKKPVTHTFLVSDESDNFDGVENYEVQFGGEKKREI